VRIHHGTGNVAARVLLLEANEVSLGGRALAQLRLEAPWFAWVGDRFIVRDWAEQLTLAGGVILNVDLPQRGFRTASHCSQLQKLASNPSDAAVAVDVYLHEHHWQKQASLLIRSQFSATEIEEAVSRLQSQNRVVVRGDFVADLQWWTSKREAAEKGIDLHHRDHPETAGMPLSQLRALLVSDPAEAELMEALIADLLQSGFAQSGTFIRRATHVAALPPHLQAAGTELRRMLQLNPVEPPSRKELAATPSAQQALRFLIQTGEVTEISPDIVMASEGFKRAKATIRQRLSNGSPASVSELKQLVGTSRRVMVPLLEKLDRDGVTKRQADFRVLGPKGA
jgi:selenocysteine-specific elongation factor